MMTKHKQALFGSVAALAIFAVTADAAAQCCGAPSYGAAYQTYSPVAYTAYQPVSSWYPGCCLFNWCGSLWGGGYSAGYAPTYSTYYRPAYYASYAPVSSCSTCSTCSSCYTPSCSTCTSCYTPSCTTCCDSCSNGCSGGCSSCSEGGGCAACGVTQASASDGYSSSTYQSQPQLSPGENPPPERTYETDKPSSNNGFMDAYPEPSSDSSDESASFFESPPLLINPKDQTALGNGVTPVRTAVYHRPVAGQPSKVRNISLSRRQAQLDAEGWTSVAE